MADDINHFSAKLQSTVSRSFLLFGLHCMKIDQHILWKNKPDFRHTDEKNKENKDTGILKLSYLDKSVYFDGSTRTSRKQRNPRGIKTNFLSISGSRKTFWLWKHLTCWILCSSMSPDQRQPENSLNVGYRNRKIGNWDKHRLENLQIFCKQ